MKYFKNLLKGLDKALLIAPLALAILSITMMVSTSYDDGFNFSREVIIQTVAYIIGVGCVIFIANLDYTTFADIEKWLYIGSIVFLLLVYVPFLGVELFGARSWIDLKFTTVQPSEFVKITFILLFANYLQKNKNRLFTFGGLMKAALYCAPFIFIVLKEDLGSALVFLAIWIVMVFYAGVDYGLFARCAAVTALSIPIAYKFMAPHQKERIDAFLHPDNLQLGGNYQVWQSKVAIGSGGLFGKGLFQGTQKELEFLPVRSSDFIFSVICEELGFVGGAVAIGLLGWLIYASSKVAIQCKDFYGSLIVIGIIGMLAFQSFENIAMTMGAMPVTGITLPFLSYGGSSIISNMIAIGFIINIAIKNRGVKF